MSTWTQEDVAKLRAAVVSLASGEAVLVVKYSGPPAREVTYQQRDLKQMRELLASMEAAQPGARRVGRMRTSKGFGR